MHITFGKRGKINATSEHMKITTVVDAQIG